MPVYGSCLTAPYGFLSAVHAPSTIKAALFMTFAPTTAADGIALDPTPVPNPSTTATASGTALDGLEQYAAWLSSGSVKPSAGHDATDGVLMTPTHKLAIDLDGCLADFNGAFLKQLQAMCPNPSAPLQWTNHPPVWHWMEFYGWQPHEIDLVWSYCLTQTTQFWANLRPIDFTALKDLKAIQLKTDLHFITVRTGEKVEEQTARWLRNYGIERFTLHFTTEKTKTAHQLGCDVLIDDNSDNLGGFTDVKEYLIHRPYNALATGRWQRITSVSAALRHCGATYDVVG